MTRALLLDEMLSPAIALSLCELGCDASAVAQRAELRSLPDLDILEAALSEGRVVVTCNVRDFALLDREWMAAGRAHAGIIYVSSRRFPAVEASTRAIASALAERHRLDRWPSEGESVFL